MQDLEGLHFDDNDFNLAWMLGGLVVVFSRLEGALFALASLPLTDQEPRFVAKRTASHLTGDVLALADDGLYFKEGDRIRAALEGLVGRDGLIEKRNPYIHSVWRWDREGAITRSHITEAFAAGHWDATRLDFDADELARITVDIARRSDELDSTVAALRATYL